MAWTFWQQIARRGSEVRAARALVRDQKSEDRGQQSEVRRDERLRSEAIDSGAECADVERFAEHDVHAHSFVGFADF